MVKFSIELCTTPSSENPGRGGGGMGLVGKETRSGPARVNKYAQILIEL